MSLFFKLASGLEMFSVPVVPWDISIYRHIVIYSFIIEIYNHDDDDNDVGTDKRTKSLSVSLCELDTKVTTFL